MFFTQSQFTSRHQRGNMSENMITDGEEDHYLEEFFPKQVPYHLLPLIEHRIKLLCKTDATINPGEIQLINTTYVIKGKSRKKNCSPTRIYPYPSSLLDILIRTLREE